MAVRYTIPFKSYDNVQWRIDIADKSETATPVTLRGLGGTICELSYNGPVDNPYTVLIPSTLAISLHNQDNVDINELQLAQDRDFTVKLYRINELKWSGFLKTEGIQRKLLSAPADFQLEAFDGLSALNDIPYSHADLIGGRVLINYFRQILFAPANLGNALPIRWTNSLQCTAFVGEDVFSKGVEWSADNQGFYSYQAQQSGGDTGKIKSCGEILEEMLRSFQCRIYQSDGKWVIRRVNDVVSGTFLYKQVSDTLGDLLINSGSENTLKLIGRSGYPFHNQDAIITTKQGLKSVIVEYEANVRENILPNGSQDILTNSQFDYWAAENGNINIQSGPSLDGRDGYSSLLIATNPILSDYYQLVYDLPLDGKTLVKYINFGFLFSPVNGFPSTDGLIIWDSEPFKIKVILHIGSGVYYLNEFGYWQTVETDIAIRIDGLHYNEIAKVFFDKFQNIIIPEPPQQPDPSYRYDLQVKFLVKPGQQYRLDNITVSVDNSNDVYESTYAATRNTTVEDYNLKISSSFGGYMVSNFMTKWYNSDAECYYRDGLYYEGTLTGLTANAIMRFRYKASKVFNGTVNNRNKEWSFDQIYLIDTFGTEKYLPLNAKYNVEKCEVFIVAMESRNDEIELTQRYYSSNDKQLSN